MECKRTGEFAHRESMHYESGEAFNGEVRSYSFAEALRAPRVSYGGARAPDA